MMVGRPYHIASLAQVISESAGDSVSNLVLGYAVQRHEDDRCRGLCPFDPLRMVVRDLRCQGCDPQHFLKALLAEPGCRRDAHCAAIPVAVVRFGVFPVQPHAEVRAVSGKGIAFPVLLHRLDQRPLYCLIVRVGPAIHQPLRHSESHDAVICKFRSLRKEFKILCLNIIRVKFIRASDNISQNSAVHQFSPFPRT